jgi:hypothetical protein
MASQMRTRAGPSLWVWLISAVLHAWVLFQWPAWQAQAAPSPRWQVQVPVQSDSPSPDLRPAASHSAELPTPVTRLTGPAQPQVATPPNALESRTPASPATPTTAPALPLPNAETDADVAALPHTDTVLAQAKTTAPVPSASSNGPTPAGLIGGFRAPTAARLRYDLQGIAKGFGYSAKAELLWQPDASQYEARLEVSHFLLGSRVQTSQGQINPEGLAPRRFGDKVRSEQAAHFQRDKGLITYSANTPDAPLLAGMQDRLSVFIQISGMLLAEPQRWGTGAVMNFHTTGARDTEPWAFQVAGMETLKMPYGGIEAMRLVRQEQKQYDQRVELWMAPSLEHLPVRIRITQTSGDQVDLLLRSKEMPSTSP